MNKVKMVTLVLVSAVLGGCAAVPKPELANEDYTRYAYTWFITDYCNWQGWISPDIAASGKTLINNNVAYYTIDVERFNREVAWFNSSGNKPSQGDCNQAAMKIHEQNQQITTRKQQITEYNQSIKDLQETLNTNKVKNTYCNRIGTQTICNTF